LSALSGQEELTYLETFHDFRDMTTEEREESLSNAAVIK